MESVLEILGKCEKYFASKGVPNPKLDSQLLLAEAMGCKRLELFLKFDHPVYGQTLDKFREFVKRRSHREPLQHIIGNVDFFGLTLKCDRRALVPRPETEELCEIVVGEIFTDKKASLSILDLGTGSGAIALALANNFENSEVIGTDISKEALSLAQENANLLGLAERVSFLQSDWFSALGERKFDLIVANPPYLTREEIQTAEPEVRDFDPELALYSADEGASDLVKILSSTHSYLNDGGAVICECGVLHPKLLKNYRFPELEGESRADSSGRDRFYIGKCVR